MIHHRDACIAVAVLALSTAVSGMLVSAAPAASRRTSRSQSRTSQLQRAAAQAAMQQTKARIALAQRIAAAAQQRATAAQAKVQSAQGRAQTALSDIQGVKSNSAASTAQLHRIEAAIEASQPDDSEFAEARCAWEQADKDFQAEQQRVLNSAAYKASYQQALQSVNKAELLPKVRPDALDHDAAFQSIRTKRDAAEVALQRIRWQLYEQDADWAAAAKSAARCAG